MRAYAARICWNSAGWNFPTGEARALETADTWVKQTGFGHEEWIFDLTRQIDGWKYAFLQPVNDSFNRVSGETIDVHLFTVGPGGAWFHVARIRACEVLTPEMADRTRAEFKAHGWLKEMAAQVETIGGDPTVFATGSIVNIRFRPERDLDLLAKPVPVADGAKLKSLRRYLLYALEGTNEVVRRTWPSRRGTHAPGKTGVIPKAAVPSGTMELAHAAFQNELYALLVRRYGRKNVIKEENFADVTVTIDGIFTIVEVKVDPRPVQAIREGLGQLLEYAFRYISSGKTVASLVIAAPGRPNEEDLRYLEHLRSERGLPLRYLCLRRGLSAVDIGDDGVDVYPRTTVRGGSRARYPAAG